MRKPRNRFVVIVSDYVKGEGHGFNKLPAVATEEKAKQILEEMEVNGFVKCDGEIVWQYSIGASIFPPRWIRR